MDHRIFATSSNTAVDNATTVEWRGDVLWVEPKGDVSTHRISALETKIHPLIASAHRSRWVRMEVYQDDDITGHDNDEKAHMEEHLTFNQQRGCQYLIVVASHILVRESIADICGKIGLPMVYCHDLSQAHRWLRSKGYILT